MSQVVGWRGLPWSVLEQGKQFEGGCQDNWIFNGEDEDDEYIADPVNTVVIESSSSYTNLCYCNAFQQ